MLSRKGEGAPCTEVSHRGGCQHSCCKLRAGTTVTLSLGPAALSRSIDLSSFKLQLLLHTGKITKISDFFVMSPNNFKALCKNLMMKNGIGLVGGGVNWNSVGLVCCVLMTLHTITGTRIEMFSLKRGLVLDTKESASHF